MRLEDVMTRRVVTCDVEETVEAAERKLREGRFRHLPVTRAGALVGMVSDRDLVAQRSTPTRPVGELLGGAPITAAPDWPIESAARLMTENSLGALPIVQRDRLVGIVAESDILGYLCRLLGVREPGTRLEVRLTQPSRQLADVVAIVRDHGAPLVSLVTEPAGSGGQIVALRLGTIDPRAVVGALRAAGLEVAEPVAELAS